MDSQNTVDIDKDPVPNSDVVLEDVAVVIKSNFTHPQEH